MIDVAANILVSVFFSAVLPVVGIVLLLIVGFKFWVHYVQQKFISGIDWVLLEIIPPRDVDRSPRAMELFFTNALYHLSGKGWAEEYWQGAVWFWFSLEIVSIEGQVHFYIRTPSRIKKLIETQMYAQYPQAQVKVVPDYTLAVDEISPKSDWNGWGCEFKLLRPDAYPISTYVDFGLDKDPKEEHKVDPIAAVIETFSSIGKGEQVWLQIVVKGSQKKYHTKGTWFGKHEWVEEAKIIAKEMLDPYSRHHEATDTHPATKAVYTPSYLQGTIERISKKTNKLGFETGIRLFYAAKKENFSNNTRRDMRLIFRQYANPDANQFQRFNSAQGDLYPFSSVVVGQSMILRYRNRLLKEYRERAFFHLPLRHHLFSKHNLFWPIQPFIFPGYPHHEVFILNTEELATIWHFPGQILKVPTLTRIESKEASPPPNLPV